MTGTGSGMCVFLRSKGQASCRERGERAPTPASREGQWVECVNSADIQTGSVGRQRKKKENSQKNACHKFLDQEPEAFCSFPTWFPKT